MTIEDPVEYELEGIGQTRVNAKVEMTFARGLRAILRRDPDVVLVGEIRDGETAQIAVQASLTGHGAVDPAHQQRAGRHFPSTGYGRGAFFTLHLAAGGDVAAAGAPTVPALPSATAGGCQHRPADGGPGRRAAVAAQRLSGV